jgi:hypothetical protein
MRVYYIIDGRNACVTQQSTGRIYVCPSAKRFTILHYRVEDGVVGAWILIPPTLLNSDDVATTLISLPLMDN